MTTRYRVEYALKTHRRDQFIEWIKGLLAVPFVLYSQPTGVFETPGVSMAQMSEEAHRRYAEIMRDVENMIDDHINHQNNDSPFPSKLKLLVPSVGPFFTRLPLEAAFKYQDRKRYISSRRYVSPSFNDVRLVLNSAQLMAVASTSTSTSSPTGPLGGGLRLATFDGDVTLYEDGQDLLASSPIVPRLIALMRRGVRVGIVTAAGYATADRYHARLRGLLEALADTPHLTAAQKRASLVVMGGEANYLFAFDAASPPHYLVPVPRRAWLTPEMRRWGEADIAALLDAAEAALRDCVAALNLPAVVVRKDRAVGIVPDPPHARIPRESLEETVLVVQRLVEAAQRQQQQQQGNGAAEGQGQMAVRTKGRNGSVVAAMPNGGDYHHHHHNHNHNNNNNSVNGMNGVSSGGRVPFCAFNGGRDVFVDIGDKSWGVAVCQRWFARVGDGTQLASCGLFNSRGAATSSGTPDWGGAADLDGAATDYAATAADDWFFGGPDAADNSEHGVAIGAHNTLHVGDQFLSAGANDFKARSVGTTAWIASPTETVELLDELTDLMEKKLS